MAMAYITPASSISRNNLIAIILCMTVAVARVATNPVENDIFNSNNGRKHGTFDDCDDDDDDDDCDDDEENKTWTIVGVAGGTVVAAIVIIVIMVCICRRNQRKNGQKWFWTRQNELAAKPPPVIVMEMSNPNVWQPMPVGQPPHPHLHPNNDNRTPGAPLATAPTITESPSPLFTEEIDHQHPFNPDFDESSGENVHEEPPPPYDFAVLAAVHHPHPHDVKRMADKHQANV